MAKRRYTSPILNLDPGTDPIIIPIGGSQGTSGDDPQFTWDPQISQDDIDLFWATYDETDLAAIDTDHDLYISKDEFDAWYNAVQPW